MVGGFGLEDDCLRERTMIFCCYMGLYSLPLEIAPAREPLSNPPFLPDFGKLWLELVVWLTLKHADAAFYSWRQKVLRFCFLFICYCELTQI